MEQMHDFRVVSTKYNCYSASLLKSRAEFHLTQKGGLVIRGLLPHAFRTSYKCISRFHRALVLFVVCLASLSYLFSGRPHLFTVYLKLVLDFLAQNQRQTFFFTQ